MGIINIFGKKTPPSTEKPQIKRTLMRGPNGKFISKKQKVKKTVKKKVKIHKIAAPVIVTFFGREINKVYDGKKWYFTVDDILGLASPLSPDGRVRQKKTLKNVQKKVSKKINNVVYADADGCIKLLKEVEGVFPGPLVRWLAESSQLPYEAPPKVKKAAPSGEPPASNPSDRGM